MKKLLLNSSNNKKITSFILFISVLSLTLLSSNTHHRNHAYARPEKKSKISDDSTLQNKIEKKKASIIRYTRNISGTWVVPSSILAVVKGDKVIIKEAFRTAADRTYPAASHTKFLTTLSLMQLEDRGLLNVDDPISKYIPAKLERPGSAPITIRHLMSHTSGLGWGGGRITVKLGPKTPAITVWRQVFPTGQNFLYLNDGYDLLGVLITHLTGKSLPEYFRKNIIEPLGMPNIVLSKRTRGSSGMRWSLNDMVILLKLILNKGKLNGKRIVQERWFTTEIYRQNRISIMPGKYKSFRGLCWRVLTIDDKPYSINHASLYPGSGGWMQVYPTLNVAYIFMSNTPVHWDKSPPFQSYYFGMQRRLNAFAGMLSSDDLNPVHFNLKTGRVDYLTKFTGTYLDPEKKEQLSIKAAYPYLKVKNSVKGSYRLSPVSENRFMAGNQRYYFIRHDGRVLGIINNRKYYIKQ